MLSRAQISSLCNLLEDYLSGMKILMVCLGNICRSPVAEGLLRQKAEVAGLADRIVVDSCGTGNQHAGEAPDERSAKNAMENGLDIRMLRSRQIRQEDFDEFDRLYVMDKSNYQNVMAMARDAADREKVELILNMSTPGSNTAVPDPWFGGGQGFQTVYDMLDEACDAIIDDIKK